MEANIIRRSGLEFNNFDIDVHRLIIFGEKAPARGFSKSPSNIVLHQCRNCEILLRNLIMNSVNWKN